MCKLTRGERFKDARIVHNKNGSQSMDEVYAATGVAASMIKDLEDDERNRSVGYEKIAMLSAHYGVSADYLLGFSDDPSRRPCAVEELGLSAKAVNIIKNWKMVDRYDDAIKGLDLLITKGSFLFFASRISEFCQAVDSNIALANTYDALATMSDDPKLERWKDEVVAENAFRDAFLEHYPQYKNHFDVRVGARYVATLRRDLEDDFSELLRSISNYNEFVASQLDGSV